MNYDPGVILNAIQQRLGQGIGDAESFVRNTFASPSPTPDPRKDPNSMKLTVGVAPDFVNEAQAAGGIQTPSPAPSLQPIQNNMGDFQRPDPKVVEQVMRQGLRAYGKGKESPMEKWIPQMVEATQRYPIFAQHPYLIPAVSLNETSGYTNYTHLNNPLSWGARLKESGTYIPKSVEQSLEDMMTAVGGDPNRGQGFDEETAKQRMATASYYDKFRKSGKLEDFVDAYERGNPKYLPTLQQNLSLFNQ